MPKIKLLEHIASLPVTEETLSDAFSVVVELEDRAEIHKWCVWIRKHARKIISVNMYDLFYKTYLFEAQKGDFEAYCIYIEKNREPEKKFYMPRRKQLKVLVQDLQDLFDHEIDFLGISLPPRVGKLLSDDTPVLTTNGWKNHGDLKVGDYVYGLDGMPKRVQAVSPKAEANVRVHFTNGETIDCHENHEWVVYNRHKQKYCTMETKEMFSDYESGQPGKRGHRYYYQLPCREPLGGEEKDLPVGPYTLGAWLGDGRNTNPDICGDINDKAIVDKVTEEGYCISWSTVHKTTGVVSYGFKLLRQDLQKLGMCYSRRKSPKHIPDIYLTASKEQRLELLAGLLDTDGCLIKKERRYQFTTADEELKDSFLDLIATFGWRCSVQRYEPKVSSSGIVGKRPYWVIGFNPTCYIPCVLERKQLREFSKQRKISICGFERIEGKRGNCIQVEGGVYLAGNSMLPTHNSTLCIFFMTFVMGHRPAIANVMSGHSSALTDGFHGEIVTILTTPEDYLWQDVFPGVELVNKSAKNLTVDLEKKKRFPTITCRSIGGTLTGAVEVGNGGVLYCDDLVEDLEESLNPERLENKYNAYLNQLKDRKKNDAVELMVGTRWNVFDPLGRIQSQYEGNPKYRFRVIPALDENDESNFDYEYGLGFSTEYYHDMRESIDDATWWAKYMGQPYIREGLLFPEGELRYYNGVLPGEPDRKVFVCDVAFGGGDSVSAPFGYIYGEDCYIPDVVFNNGNKDVTIPEVVGKVKKHMPHMGRFEANNGGDAYAEKVDADLRKDGVKVNISSLRAPTGQSKLSRIIQFSPEIKRFYFLDRKHQDKEYREFMREVTMFVQNGKNKHDDAADSLAMLADFINTGVKTISVFKRPF